MPDIGCFRGPAFTHVLGAALPDPAVDARARCQFALQDRGRRKRRVRASFAREVEDAWWRVHLEHGEQPLLRYAMARHDAELAKQLQLALGAAGHSQHDDPDDMLPVADYVRSRQAVCAECNQCCASAKLLGHHRRYQHSVPSAKWLFATGTFCSMCSTEFHTRPHLARHLHRVERCFSGLVYSMEPLSEEALSALEAQTAVGRRATRVAGTSLLAAHIPAARM